MSRVLGATAAITCSFILASNALAASWGSLVYIGQSGQLDPGGIVTLSRSTVVGVWAEEGSPDYQIVARRSTDAGSTWGSRQIIGHLGGDGQPLSAAGRGAYVDVVFDTGSGVAFVRSTNRGASFGTPVAIPNCGLNPSVSHGTDGLVAISCWDGTGISIAVSKNYGKSFGAARHVIDAAKNDGSYMYPRVAAGNGVIYLAFFDGGDIDNGSPPTLYVSRSRDGGTTWSLRMAVAAVYDDQDSLVSWATTGTHAYLAFRPVGAAAQYIRTTDSGTTWSTRLNLPNGSSDAKLFLSGGVLRALFLECPGSCSSYYSQSGDGVNWTIPQKVSKAVSDSQPIGLGYTGSKVVIAFSTGGFGGYYTNSRFYVRPGSP